MTALEMNLLRHARLTGRCAHVLHPAEASGFIGTVTSEANVTAAAAGVAWGAGGQSMTASGVPSSHAGPHSLGGTHSSLEAAHTHVEAMHSHVAPGQGATTLHVPAGGTAAGKPVLEKRLTRCGWCVRRHLQDPMAV